MPRPIALLLAVAISMPASINAEPTTSLGKAFKHFWQAENPEQAANATQAILATGATFEDVFTRLEAGRTYSRKVDTGRIDLINRTSDRTRHHYRILVPEDYDPARRYRVVFFLHGGVSRPAWRKGGRWWRNYDSLEDSDRISVVPSSWDRSMWWQRRQAENLPAILDHLKRHYNLDENDVHMLGISDGATGAYFFAFRDPTPWASFLPFIGHPGVLANRTVEADGDMYPRNALGKPFFVVNGGQDRLYPVTRVLPYLDLLHRAGAEIDFRAKMDAGHDLSWWPDEAESIRTFVDSHKRDPLPERLAWETEHTDRYNRVSWLIIDELGTTPHDSRLNDHDTLVPTPTIGIQADPKSSQGVRLHKVHSGSVADKAGLAKGDVILELAGQPTPTLESLGEIVNARGGWGTSLPTVVERRGQRLELSLVTPKTPDESELTQAFPRSKPSGRVELHREGNTIHVRTQGVARYSLLLSPRELDFEREIVVLTNDRESFRGHVEPDLSTLLEFAARDNDRTLLFGARLEITP